VQTVFNPDREEGVMGICDATATEVVHSDYMLVNKGKEAPIRFAALAAIYDPQTIRHLETLGVACGWRCLEVGAGSGTIAKWLADRVGPTDVYWSPTSIPVSWSPCGAPL
jgi:hypothetical protein